MRNKYAIPCDGCVLTAGSTRDGEEQHIIKAYSELSADIGNLFLVLVPRHPERTAEIASLLESAGLHYQRRTTLPGDYLFQHGEVLLVDTVGEMMDLYALSDIAYVGGSLVPIGGHNLLEPASVGVPSILHTPEELTASCRALVTSAELRRILGQNGLKLMRDNGGATARHMKIIAGYL